MEKNEFFLSLNEKVVELLKNENFIAKLNDAVDLNEVRNIFASEGIEISLDKAKVIMEALHSVNERIQRTEEITEEELDEIAGGGSIIRKALELVLMSAVVAEGIRITGKVKQKGGVSKKISNYTDKVKGALISAEDNVVNWISGK